MGHQNTKTGYDESGHKPYAIVLEFIMVLGG